MTALEPLPLDPVRAARLSSLRRTATDWFCALAMVLLLALA